MRQLKTVILTTSLLVLVVLFQNCKFTSPIAFTGMERASYASSSSDAGGGTAGGNGSGYDGKPRIYHHLVDGFTCEGLDRPESILIRKGEAEWYLIENTREKCAYRDRVRVEGVIYEEATKRAIYNGKIYFPARPYVVDSSEDANLPDLALDDGVCADVNEKCSLRAAIEQVGMASFTAETSVRVPAATYLLSQTLALVGGASSFPVTITGDGAAMTILDGGLSVSHLSIDGFTSASVRIENIGFHKGKGVLPAASAILPKAGMNSAADLTLANCAFIQNAGAPAIYGGPQSGRLTVRDSLFQGNQLAGIGVFGMEQLTVEDSIFKGNANFGVWVTNRTANVTIRKSSFISNEIGIALHSCQNCKIENTTIYHSSGPGLKVSSADFGATSGFDPVVSNSTIYANSKATGSNIELAFASPAQQLVVNNTIVAVSDSNLQNCGISSGSSGAVYATNSIFDDSSCLPSGAGNIFADPKLASTTSVVEGKTPTLSPLFGSPAVDKGSNALCLTEDQRGRPRPVAIMSKAAVCDIGAVEEQYGTQ